MQDVVERLPFDIFEGNVRTTFFDDWNDLRDSRMIQLRNDSGFVRESCRVSGSAFEFRVRNFEDDHPACLAIKRFEDRRHSASLDEGSDLEALVENLTNLEFAAQRPATLRDEVLRSR